MKQEKIVGVMKTSKMTNSFEITFLLIWGDSYIPRADDLEKAL